MNDILQWVAIVVLLGCVLLHTHPTHWGRR